jgi:hypothetical protein
MGSDTMTVRGAPYIRLRKSGRVGKLSKPCGSKTRKGNMTRHFRNFFHDFLKNFTEMTFQVIICHKEVYGNEGKDKAVNT